MGALWAIVSQRATLAFLLLGACVNVSFSALAGYINPKDYLADVVAAHQFLKHAIMYPYDLPPCIVPVCQHQPAKHADASCMGLPDVPFDANRANCFLTDSVNLKLDLA